MTTVKFFYIIWKLKKYNKKKNIKIKDTILAHSQFLDSNGTAVYSLLVRNYDTKYDIK